MERLLRPPSESLYRSPPRSHSPFAIRRQTATKIDRTESLALTSHWQQCGPASGTMRTGVSHDTLRGKHVKSLVYAHADAGRNWCHWQQPIVRSYIVRTHAAFLRHDLTFPIPSSISNFGFSSLDLLTDVSTTSADPDSDSDSDSNSNFLVSGSGLKPHMR